MSDLTDDPWMHSPYPNVCCRHGVPVWTDGHESCPQILDTAIPIGPAPPPPPEPAGPFDKVDRWILDECGKALLDRLSLNLEENQ